MSSSATGVGMPICFLWAILLILTQKSSQKFGDVLGIMVPITTLRVVPIQRYRQLVVGRSFQSVYCLSYTDHLLCRLSACLILVMRSFFLASTLPKNPQSVAMPSCGPRRDGVTDASEYG